jgi:hypothetical protein
MVVRLGFARRLVSGPVSPALRARGQGARNMEESGDFVNSDGLERLLPSDRVAAPGLAPLGLGAARGAGLPWWASSCKKPG